MESWTSYFFLSVCGGHGRRLLWAGMLREQAECNGASACAPGPNTSDAAHLLHVSIHTIFSSILAFEDNLGDPSGHGTQFADIKWKVLPKNKLLTLKRNSYFYVNKSLSSTRWATLYLWRDVTAFSMERDAMSSGLWTNSQPINSLHQTMLPICS